MTPTATMLSALGAVAAMIFSAAVAYGVVAFQKWAGIQLTDQQRQIIQDAADAIAGALKLLIAKGEINAIDLHSSQAVVKSVVQQHLSVEVMNALDDRKMSVEDLTIRAVAMVGHDKDALVTMAIAQ